MGEVSAGAVERTVDSSTGLEIFCYIMAQGAPLSEVAAMCRGLVLHPPSANVVATPFVHFGAVPRNPAAHPAEQGQQPVKQSRQLDHSLLPLSKCDPGSQRGQAPLSPGASAASSSMAESIPTKMPPTGRDKCVESTPQDANDSSCSSASFNVDGTLIIAFLWDGQLRTSTRRRMDSEQVCTCADMFLCLGISHLF